MGGVSLWREVAAIVEKRFKINTTKVIVKLISIRDSATIRACVGRSTEDGNKVNLSFAKRVG